MSGNPGQERRRFLQRSIGLAGAVAAPSLMLSACGGIEETFVEPARLVSSNGLLDIEVRYQYLRRILNGVPVNLRSMVVPGVSTELPAPTLQVKAGDTLRIKVVNALPPNPATAEPVRHLHYPNSANLHVHGLHVNPGIVRAATSSTPAVYGDYVVDDPEAGVRPGETRQHEFAIGADHPPGTYWYHPHLHGSTAAQVGSGMAGAIVIQGATDNVPEIARARERIFVFQSPLVDARGEVESFSQTARLDGPSLINGVRLPRLVIGPGEVQHWRFVNAFVGKYLNLSLQGHDLNLVSFDGNPRSALQRISAASQEGLVLAPGNRGTVLVRGGQPGTYLLVSKAMDMGRAVALPEEVLAEVVVTGASQDMTLPQGPLPVPAALKPISAEEVAAKGGLRRNIVMRMVFNDTGPVTEPPASRVLDLKPGDLEDWVYQTDGTVMADTVFTMGAGSGQASANPGMPAYLYPFQSPRAVRQTVSLGSVEEWTVFNMDRFRHPFHIHINPVYVVAVNGVPLAEPYWADTIGLPLGGTPDKPTSVTFRTRFLDFKGSYVMHCHVLNHEDMGMMQLVDVV